MTRLAIPASIAAALALSGCVTVFDATDDYGWQGQNAQPFDSAKAECRWFLTNDERLTGIAIPGIARCASFAAFDDAS